MSTQYYADLDANGNIIGFYNDDIWDVAKIPATAVKITEAQWNDCVSNQGKYIVKAGALVLAPAPTESEQLASAKAAKMAELNVACNKAILGRFQSTVGSPAMTYEFSYDDDAQKNLNKAGRAFDKAMITSIGWTAYDVVTGSVVRLTLSAADFDTVFKDSLAHLNVNISKFRDTLQPAVEAAATVADVIAVVW